jgi:ribosomal protein L11 methyltransferase
VSAPRFPFLEVDVVEDQADEVGFLLGELGADGVELRDDATLTRGPGGGRVRLVASYASRAAAEQALESLLAELPELSARVDELVGDDWRDRYKDYFRPFALTERLTVAPPWLPRPPGDHVIVMDPGRAFGTGLHATTALVAAQLDADAARYQGHRVLDVGTGSGVLGLAALSFGAREVVATDNDPEVIEIVEENAAANGLAERLAVDTTAVEAVEGAFPYVVANIRAPVLVAMAEALRSRVATGGRLVLSGILASEAAEVVAAFVAAGFSLAEQHRREEPPHPDAWVALVFDG